ncbi:MAG: DEAD/DEAH box helicase [Candidatus Nanopelagicales bacterium]|nr:DEAD/DEAH box helicase [Candidatus Nanopelagicales bacterium]
MTAPLTPDDVPSEPPTVADLLALAVQELGGQPRAGQAQMADAIGECLGTGSGTVLVQAGTGTGKSLAYLVPAALHATSTGDPVVIATATLALQRQLVDKDLPVVSRALSPALGREVTYAVLKGRSNYLCLDRLTRGSPDPEESALFDTPTTRLGRQAARLQKWARTTTTGDRDDLTDPVDGRVWSGLSVS